MDSFFALLFFGAPEVSKSNIEDIELNDEDSPGGNQNACVVS
jgi:hypothetical protein